MVVFLVPQQFFLLFPPFLCPAASSLVAPPLERARRRWRSGSGSSPSRGPGRGPVRGPGPGPGRVQFGVQVRVEVVVKI